MKNQRLIWAVMITIITLITAWNVFQTGLSLRDTEPAVPSTTSEVSNV